MFDPGGVLHAALRAALRRSQECFARGVVPRQARDDKSPAVPPLCPFRFAARVLHEGIWGAEKRKRTYSCIISNLKPQVAPASGSRPSALHTLQKDELDPG